MKNPFRDLWKGELAALVGTFALLAVFSSYLVLHVKDAHREGTFDRRPPISDLFSGKPGTVPNTPDPAKIEPWMTFKYVNVVFELHDDVLKNALKIEDATYPNLPIGKYVKKNGLNRDEFLSSVREAVKANWKNQSPK